MTAAPHTKSLSPPSPNSYMALNNPSYMNGNLNPQHHDGPDGKNVAIMGGVSVLSKIPEKKCPKFKKMSKNKNKNVQK